MLNTFSFHDDASPKGEWITDPLSGNSMWAWMLRLLRASCPPLLRDQPASVRNRSRRFRQRRTKPLVENDRAGPGCLSRQARFLDQVRGDDAIHSVTGYDWGNFPPSGASGGSPESRSICKGPRKLTSRCGKGISIPCSRNAASMAKLRSLITRIRWSILGMMTRNSKLSELSPKPRNNTPKMPCSNILEDQPE